MMESKENRTKQIESILFIVMLFFVIVSFSGRSEKMTYNYSHYEVDSGLHLNSVSAMISDCNNTPVLQKGLLTTLDKTGFLFLNYSFKIAADNHNFSQRFHLLDILLPILNPLSFSRFYYHLFSFASKELPAIN